MTDNSPDGSSLEALPLPPEELIVREPGQLKALGDPLRLRLIETMEGRMRHGWTVKELAAALGTSQTRLYRHVNLLVEAGLIRVAGTQLVGGIVQRHYQLSARAFRMERTLASLPETGAALNRLLDVAVEDARRNIRDGLASGIVDRGEGPGGRVTVIQGRLRLRPDRRTEFGRRLQALIDEASGDNADDAPDASDYGFLLALYPEVLSDEDQA